MFPYLDTSVVIDALDPTSVFHTKIVAALAPFTPRAFALSDLVRMECLVRPIRDNDTAQIAALNAFFRRAIVLAMPPAVFDQAARLRADHALKTPDALHLATALHHGCGEFWTNDRDLAKKSVGLTFRSF